MCVEYITAIIVEMWKYIYICNSEYITYTYNVFPAAPFNSSRLSQRAPRLESSGLTEVLTGLRRGSDVAGDGDINSLECISARALIDSKVLARN